MEKKELKRILKSLHKSYYRLHASLISWDGSGGGQWIAACTRQGVPLAAISMDTVEGRLDKTGDIQATAEWAGQRLEGVFGAQLEKVAAWAESGAGLDGYPKCIIVDGSAKDNAAFAEALAAMQVLM